MIRVLLLGRTGNNLFQYALGRLLARRHGVPLVLGAGWFNAEGWRGVRCLRRLGIEARWQRAGSLAQRALLKWKGIHPWELLEKRGVPVIREPLHDLRFRPEVLEAPGDCVLIGYFQSPRYFEEIEPLLRGELALDGLDWPAPTQAMAGRLTDENSVAVHVRRGDYAGNRSLDLCGPAYYAAAVAELRERLERPRFFVFSDDPTWCRREFEARDVEVCDLPAAAGDPLHDLFLMSRARHHVIANSSYSWWAAWLGKKPDQIVKVPPRWFGGDFHTPIAEKLCAGWETVD